MLAPAVPVKAAAGHVLHQGVNCKAGALLGARYQRLGFQVGQCPSRIKDIFYT